VGVANYACAMSTEFAGRLGRVLDSLPVKGLLVGLAASKALDAVSIALYENEDRRTRWAENRARHHRHAYERAVEQMAGVAGKSLNRRQRKVYGWKFHQLFGLLGGVQYVAARKRSPRIGAGMGLLFGTAFFVLMDELLVPLLRWTPGPRAFSWKVHARGAAAHLAYGVAAEAAARVLDRAAAATAPA
jgi:putative membrane protein